MRQYVLMTMLMLPLCLWAQENNPDDWMQPDRPGMATRTGVMPFKAVMWETGFQGDWAGTHAVTLPTIVEKNL